MAALRADNPLAYINDEVKDYNALKAQNSSLKLPKFRVKKLTRLQTWCRNEEFSEIEREMADKLAVYEQELSQKEQEVDQWHKEEETDLITQYKNLDKRRKAFEEKKQQCERRWKTSTDGNSKEYHGKDSNNMCLDDQNNNSKYRRGQN